MKIAENELDLFLAPGIAHAGDRVREAVLMKPPDGRKPFDHDEVMDRFLDAVTVIQEERLRELENLALPLPFPWEHVFRDVRIVFNQATGIADRSSFRIVERNGDSSFQPSAIAEADTKEFYRFFDESPSLEIRMLWVQILQLEIERGIDHHLLLVLGNLRETCIRVWRRLDDLRPSELLLKLQRSCAEILPVFWIPSGQKRSEVQNVALCPALETLEHLFLQIRGEGVFLPIAAMLWQGTASNQLFPPLGDGDAV